LAAIITVCKDNLNLPIVDPLNIYLYRTSSSFQFYTRKGPTIAAFAKENTIHINLEKFYDGPLMSILAHEYGHVVQEKIGASDSIPYLLREGFADWVSAKVLHFLQWQDFTITKNRIIRELLWQKDKLPDIRLLYGSTALWISELKQARGSVIAHDMATLAVDKLVQQRGLAAVLAYQQTGDFDSSFGMPFEQVAASVENLLAEKTSRQTFDVMWSDWPTGYTWTYIRNESGNVTLSTNEVVGQETFRGRRVFVVRSADKEYLYDKDDFTILAVRKDGKFTTEVEKTSGFLSWPLHSEKKWRMSLREKDLETRSVFEYKQDLIVAGMEKIQVHASEFNVIKIEAYGSETGKLRAEYWYSPKVKWFVKSRSYLNDAVGSTEEELLNVNLHHYE